MTKYKDTMNIPYKTHIKKKYVMWYKVKELHRDGLNKSQISRKLGIDRGTVRQYLRMSEDEFLSSGICNREYSHKLDGYEPFIVGLLRRYPGFSSRQIEDRLKERYGDEVAGICSKTVFNFVGHLRLKHGIPKGEERPPRPYEKLAELPFGEYGQADFGEYWMERADGGRRKVYFFVLVLCRSRYKFVFFRTHPFNTAAAVHAHELAFRHFGGMPRKILYDQDRVLLHDENLGDLLLTRGFSAFVAQQHFEPVFCRKSDPESKGKVENVVKYVKGNFLKGRPFEGEERLNTDCLSWLSRTGNGSLHHGTFRVPAEVFREEGPHLRPYHGTPVAPKEELRRYRVRKDNTICYRCSFYTLPPGTYRDATTQVEAEEVDGRLLIYSVETGKQIGSHDVSEERGRLVSDPAHKPLRGADVPQKERQVAEHVGDEDTVSLFLAELAADKPRYYRKNLQLIIRSMGDYSPQTMREAILACLDRCVYNGKVLMEVAESIRRKRKEPPRAVKAPACMEMPPGDASAMQPERTDISTYNQYFS